MRPTLGRIVHWVDGLGQTFAAIISGIESDTDVVLTVFDRGHTVCGVRARLGGPGGARSWFWPPRTE